VIRQWRGITVHDEVFAGSTRVATTEPTCRQELRYEFAWS
jgi:hypothetical protein